MAGTVTAFVRMCVLSMGSHVSASSRRASQDMIDILVAALFWAASGMLRGPVRCIYDASLGGFGGARGRTVRLAYGLKRSAVWASWLHEGDPEALRCTCELSVSCEEYV